MSDKPVYLESWSVEDGDIVSPDYTELSIEDQEAGYGLHHWMSMFDRPDQDPSFDESEKDRQRTRLAAAAPALVRVLLSVEWNCGSACGCPSCEVNSYGGRVFASEKDTEHKPGCIVDAALTDAGFPNQASRDEARKRIREANPTTDGGI